MKEITRIHLAKVAYDIEIDAKKDIQTYIAALERYADDIELMSDIEIRITELLAERGVAAGGVITKSDVEAVRAQLGEPSDFASEDMKAAGHATEPEGEHRRVYRDQDGAIVGGVLAGFAQFFGIDALWVRIIFIALLFASFGTAIIIYLILWLIIPPAQTAADKLRMSGHPVTLASIKELGERAEPAIGETARVVRGVLRIGLGSLLVLGAIGAIAAVVAVAGIPFFDASIGWRITDTWWLTVGYGLCALAGLLLAALCAVLAGATFRRQWSRRTSVAVVSIIIVGIVSFFGGLGTVWYGTWQDDALLDASQIARSENLPADFKNVKTLTIGGGDGTHQPHAYIDYIVSDENRYELSALPGLEPKIEISPDGTSATMRIESAGNAHTTAQWWRVPPTLYVYGPALDTIIPKNGEVYYHTNSTQENLNVTTGMDAFSLAGSYKHVRVSNSNATVNLRNGSIEHLEVSSLMGRTIAGVVRNLTITQRDVCPADTYQQSSTVVQAVSSGTLVYNGKEQPAKSIETDCGRVVIGDDDNEGGVW